MCTTTEMNGNIATSTTNNNRKTVLVTGGCGYIGSHTIVCLLEQNYNVVVIDNLLNSSEISLDRVCEIVNITNIDERNNRLKYFNVDICNENELRKVFIDLQQNNNITFYSCIHFAGLKVCIIFILFLSYTI